jgi:hypothetical protein
MSRRHNHHDDDADSYTEYEGHRPTRDGRGGDGGGFGGRGRYEDDDYDRPRAGAGASSHEDSSNIKSIDANEARRLQAIIKTEGESEFKNFILYVKDGDVNSNEALDLLNGNVILKQQTFIQEVGLLRVLPTWLTSVPIIVDKTESLAHRGRVCLEFLRTFQQREAMGTMGKRLGKGRRAQFETGMAFNNNWTITSSPWDIHNTPADRMRGRVPLNSSGHEKTGRVSERDASAWAEQRQSVDDSAKRWQRKK